MVVSTRWKRRLGTLGGLVLGAVFLLAAWAKAIDPEAFAEQIRAEGLEIVLSAAVLAVVLVALEAGLGAALVLGLRKAWVLLPTSGLVAIFLFLTGIFTFSLGGFYEARQADLTAFFTWHPWLYLFLVPAVSMRMWAEERKSGTVELLMTMPITLTQAITAKYLAAWAFIAVALAFTFPMVLIVTYLGDPDMGVIWAGYAGSILMASFSTGAAPES